MRCAFCEKRATVWTSGPNTPACAQHETDAEEIAGEVRRMKFVGMSMFKWTTRGAELFWQIQKLANAATSRDHRNAARARSGKAPLQPGWVIW